MYSASDYREMARLCLREAEASKDIARRKSFEAIAKLYSNSALSMEGVGSQDAKPGEKRTAPL